MESSSDCQTMCPKIVLPSTTDFDAMRRYQIERELHGGPFGVGTLNPFYQIPDIVNAGQMPGVKRPIVSMMLPGTFPLTGFIEVAERLHARAHARAQVKAGHRLGQEQGLGLGQGQRQRQQHRALTGHQALAGVTIREHFVNRHGDFHTHTPCYHICKASHDPRADLEPMGGPFGPDEYYAQHTGHFKESTFHAGNFMFNGHSVRNFENEQFGGPFGADPSFDFGRKIRSAGLRTYGYPPL